MQTCPPSTLKRRTELSLRVAVVPAIRGGSVGIARYLADGVQSLGLPVHRIELSHFAPQMKRLQNGRVDLIAAFYQQVAAHILAELQRFGTTVLLAIAQAPLRRPLLDSIRGAGVRTGFWFVEDCARFGYWRQQVAWYDHTFVIQRARIPEVRAAGAPACSYLPLACVPRLHRPAPAPASDAADWSSEVAFMGGPYPNRIRLFEQLADLPCSIWGGGWDQVHGPAARLVRGGGRYIHDADEARIYRHARMVLNPHSSPNPQGDEVRDFVNPRTFAIAGCGTLQLVDHRDHLAEHFTPGEELLVYRDLVHLRSLLTHHLAHPEEGRAIALRAMQRAHAEHTYRHRAVQMLTALMG